MPPNIPDDGWKEYQRLVIAELERHNNLLEDLRHEIGNLRTEMATRNELLTLQNTVTKHQIEVGGQLSALQVKAGGWGAIAGGFAAIVPVLLTLLFNFGRK
jgi:hypothetical protein